MLPGNVGRMLPEVQEKLPVGALRQRNGRHTDGDMQRFHQHLVHAANVRKQAHFQRYIALGLIHRHGHIKKQLHRAVRAHRHHLPGQKRVGHLGIGLKFHHVGRVYRCGKFAFYIHAQHGFLVHGGYGSPGLRVQPGIIRPQYDGGKRRKTSAAGADVESLLRAQLRPAA